MFEQYPKKRIKLPEEFKEIYLPHYYENREGKTFATYFSNKLESWMHRMVAKDIRSNNKLKTLEIGAGTLNQLKYEKPSEYDVIEPNTQLLKTSEYTDLINKIYYDIDEINISEKYDRITAIATFEHILDLPKVIAKSCLLLNPCGTLRVSIPNEGRFLWKYGWKLTTGIEFKIRHGLDYGILMKHEHVNNASEIEDALKYFFNKVKIKCFGINKLISFYIYFECSLPAIERANDYLNEYNIFDNDIHSH